MTKLMTLAKTNLAYDETYYVVDDITNGLASDVADEVAENIADDVFDGVLANSIARLNDMSTLCHYTLPR